MEAVLVDGAAMACCETMDEQMVQNPWTGRRRQRDGGIGWVDSHEGTANPLRSGR